MQEKTNEKTKYFSERLNFVFKRTGLTQKEFAEKLGVSDRSIQYWLAAEKYPQEHLRATLCERLKLTSEYLFGEKPLTIYPPPGGIVPVAHDSPSNVRIEPPHIIRRVPVVSWASAGLGHNYADLAEQIDEWVDCETKDPNSYALIIEGDSMLPDFKPGDRIVISPNREAQNGDVVVARLADSGQVFFKLYHETGPDRSKVRLTSFNLIYPPIEYERTAFRFIQPLHSMVRLWKKN
jgi:SOS-response transcriptional repressor LexA